MNNASRTIRGGTRVDATMASTLSTWKRFWRGSKPLVHTVRLQGMIATGRAPGFGPQPLNLESVERHLASAFSKKVMPDAVAITVNSPGGSPVQSDLIYTRIRALAKETGIPVFTFAEDVAASGGYYLLAAGADGVYCRDTSIVGSVGVVSGGFGFVDAIKRLGVERRVYASGRSKVQLDPFLPEKEEDLAARRRILENIHASFRDVVLDARGEKLTLNHERAFSGEVFTGREAVEHGLCDAVGEVRGVMREKFGEDVRCRRFGGASRIFGTSAFSSAREAAADVLALAKGLGAGAERRMVDAVMHAMEERAAYARFGL